MAPGVFPGECHEYGVFFQLQLFEFLLQPFGFCRSAVQGCFRGFFRHGLLFRPYRSHVCPVDLVFIFGLGASDFSFSVLAAGDADGGVFCPEHATPLIVGASDLDVVRCFEDATPVFEMSVDGFYAVYRPAVFDVDAGIAHAFQVAGEGELFFGCRCAGGEQAGRPASNK